MIVFEPCKLGHGQNCVYIWSTRLCGRPVHGITIDFGARRSGTLYKVSEDPVASHLTLQKSDMLRFWEYNKQNMGAFMFLELENFKSHLRLCENLKRRLKGLNLHCACGFTKECALSSVKVCQEIK